MNLIGSILRSILAGASSAYMLILKLFFGVITGTLVLAFAMWLLNISGLKEVNYFFFFLGGIIIFFVGLNPAAFVVSIIEGAISGGIKKEGIFKGAAEGPKRLLHFIVGMLYIFFVISGVLSTISFKQNPSSFFALFAMIVLLCVASSFYGSKIGGLFKVIIFLFVLFVCTCALWAIIPVDTKSALGISGARIQKIDNIIGSGKKEVKEQIIIIVNKEENAERQRLQKEKAINDSLSIVEKTRIEKENAANFREEIRLKKISDKRELRERAARNKREAEKKEARDKAELEKKLDKVLNEN